MRIEIRVGSNQGIIIFLGSDTTNKDQTYTVLSVGKGNMRYKLLYQPVQTKLRQTFVLWGVGLSPLFCSIVSLSRRLFLWVHIPQS